ncbi:MAG: alpha-amylase family glycosyl hydrolase [Eubacteriales bacterium]
MITFRHHSRFLSFRIPQGAVPCNTSVQIEAELGGDPGARVQLRLYNQLGVESFFDMIREGDRVRGEIPMPGVPCLVWYYFIIRMSDAYRTYYGADSGEYRWNPMRRAPIRSPFMTARLVTPEHWREGIVYQIFPDRIRQEQLGRFSRTRKVSRESGSVFAHPRPLERGRLLYAGPGADEYEPNDFFGGDCNGIREKLDYLASLGVTTIYLNPIFESASNHRYDTADYHHIDPIFGTRTISARFAQRQKSAASASCSTACFRTRARTAAISTKTAL